MTALEIVLEPITSRSEMMGYWPLLKGSKIVDLYGEEQLAFDIALVVSGQHMALKGLIDGKLRLIVIFYPDVAARSATIKQIWGPQAIRHFKNLFFAKLKEWGCEKVGGGSSKDTDNAFCRLLGLEKKFTYFEREI